MTAVPTTMAGDVSETFTQRIPFDFARRWLVFAEESNGPCFLASESTPAHILHNVGVALGAHLCSRVMADEELASLIDRGYEAWQAARDSTPDVASDSADFDALIEAGEQDLLSTAGKAELVKFLDGVFFEALGLNASDVHLQPTETELLIRYRVDGVLSDARVMPRGLANGLVSRIKVMGGMDIAERREPQDGRATVTIGDRKQSGRSIDLRISTIPTSHGERAVIRLLDTQASKRFADLETLGMPADVKAAFLDRSRRVNGIVLVTGPTGSGKTTTLYATLRTVASERPGQLNVMTIEDPIEYDLSGEGLHLSQSQVNARKGVTFAKGLRHILRQDPDVIMVGEIRDAETASIAIQASLTGHLVFSTLHTNDAASAIVRLTDLGVERYLVGASLSTVLAQRLVRKLCTACTGSGCESCGHTGYRGRQGVYELLRVDDAIRQQLSDGATASELREKAVAAGMRTLESEGERLVREGVTSHEELARVVQGTA